MRGRVALRPGQERFYNPLPLYHMNHLAVTLTAAILTHNALVLTDRFSPQRWWSEVIETDATVVHYLGVIAALLMANATAPSDTAHRVRVGVGAGIEPDLHAACEARFGFPFVEVWGMTETGRVTSDAVEPRKVGSRAIGASFPGLELAIVDDADKPVPVGEPGELVVRSSAADPRHGFFSGYLKNEIATAEAWRNGWFHTGDIVRQDAAGTVYFIDRRKNIIRRAGENIAAAEVEAVLQAHDAVLQVGVLAVVDELREEEVMAAVVLQPGHAPNRDMAERLVAHARATLAYYKAPGWIVFLDRLPTTGTQKIQKGQIFPAGSDARQHPMAHDLRALKKRGT
jgi:acyl-CoA synthetase (AMP-forming)/AMP-acid ligase II